MGFHKFYRYVKDKYILIWKKIKYVEKNKNEKKRIYLD